MMIRMLVASGVDAFSPFYKVVKETAKHSNGAYPYGQGTIVHSNRTHSNVYCSNCMITSFITMNLACITS